MKNKLGLLLSLTIFILALVTSATSYAIPKDVYRAINGQMYYDDICSSSPGAEGGTTVMLAGSNNIEKLLNYLQAHGFTLEQAAGVVGNAMHESGSPDLSLTTSSDGKAVGIMQWQDGRLRNLQTHGPGDAWKQFDTQVEYVGVELGWEQGKNGAQSGAEAATLPAMATTTTPEQAALMWEEKYERSADTVGSTGWKNRQENARKVYELYKNGPSAGSGNAQSMSSNSSEGCTSSGAAGKVNAEGYAWPIALNQQEVDGNWPCSGSCHHDGTPAFDLAKKARDDSSEGTPIIAIFNGTIKSFNNSYAGKSGCQSFQLVGDDGWWYWYGHLQASSIQDGAKVTAGQQISTVGRRECTGNGSYPHLHIDRGSPKGHYGGSVGSRDADFVPLMNQLYDELGGGGSTNQGVDPRDL